MASITRRPLRSRETQWAHWASRQLVAAGATPNGISLASIAFAFVASAAFLIVGRATSSPMAVAAYLVAVVGIQGRLLCNLFDGMVAIEGGRKTRSGEIFNELPDRIADSLVFVGAGFSSGMGGWLPHLGWGAAVIALIVAYTRTLGAAAGAGQCFIGPMAKPQRMAAVTVGCLLAAASVPWNGNDLVIAVTLGVVILGGVVTIARRVRFLIRTLEAS